MKIAIIGAGLSGLACASECEKLNVLPDIFERGDTIGWPWPTVTLELGLLSRNIGNPIQYIRENFNLSVKPHNQLKTIIMKSPNNEIKIEGDLGYSFVRGKGVAAIDQQLHNVLNRTVVHVNRPASLTEMAKKYDYVVVATGKDTEAAELGLWEDHGQISVIGGLAIGSFDPQLSTIYFNTDYAGTGYARVTPYSTTMATVELYVIGQGPFELEKRFSKFLRTEGLENLEFMFKNMPPVFQTGKVKRFKEGNILLVGRAAGLTDRLLGVGGLSAIMSGVYAARSIIQGLDYEELVKPLQDHVENMSAFRNIMENFTNDDYDKLLTLLGAPGIKQLVYNTKLNFSDLFGYIIKKLYGEQPPLNLTERREGY